jgi:hypothetical protein
MQRTCWLLLNILISVSEGKSLPFNPDGTKNQTTSSMSKDYITEYSYGVMESFNLIAPSFLEVQIMKK